MDVIDDPAASRVDSNSNSSSGALPSASSSSLPPSWWKRALTSAVRGGAAGSLAMVLQVVLLMWLRTTVNYQYKHGVDVSTALSTLYGQGGVLRFYRGASVALVTGPLSRFGDTAANEGIRELFRDGKGIPFWAVTLMASLLAASWRIAITPLDTVKTTLQVYGSTEGWERLSSKTRNYGIRVLWDGALGNSFATLAGHYPWFAVHNGLDALLPRPSRPEPGDARGNENENDRRCRRLLLCRRAAIGFCSSVASDCVSNGIRVVKTYRQTATVPLSYQEALSELLFGNENEGIFFVTRGLRLKVLSNGLSGILFSVLWKMILERLQSSSSRTRETPAAAACSKSSDNKKSN
eukprot:jgi/Psemu1/318555/estExt_fgenesh1_pm.C_910013